MHIGDNISDTDRVPTNWKEFIACRHCKQKLITYLSVKTLALSPGIMIRSDQKFITAGPIEPMSSNKASVINNEGKYASNSTEADSRVWRHCQQSNLKKQLVFSPDTDTYIIGLTNHKPGAETYIDLTPIGSEDTKILSLNELITSLQSDPDLAHVENETITTIIQSLYVSTGCDYNPFFSGIGKGMFLKAHFTYAEFINSNGSLSDVNVDRKERGYLAFLRLVGTAYFLKHRASYRGNKSPINLYHSCPSTTELEQHILWLNRIREHVWVQTLDEKNLLPSHSALRLQWLRTVWIVHMWAQSGSCQNVQLLIPEHYGWSKLEDKGYTFQWDTEEHVTAIRSNISKYTKGCKCKKSSCETKQCSCKQKGQTCGPGCRCVNCKNVRPETTQISPSPEQPLYYPAELEQSLLIGEEIELTTHSESSYTSDTDSNMDICTDEDTDSVVSDEDLDN